MSGACSRQGPITRSWSNRFGTHRAAARNRSTFLFWDRLAGLLRALGSACQGRPSSWIDAPDCSGAGASLFPWHQDQLELDEGQVEVGLHSIREKGLEDLPGASWVDSHACAYWEAARLLPQLLVPGG